MYKDQKDENILNSLLKKPPLGRLWLASLKRRCPAWLAGWMAGCLAGCRETLWHSHYSFYILYKLHSLQRRFRGEAILNSLFLNVLLLFGFDLLDSRRPKVKEIVRTFIRVPQQRSEADRMTLLNMMVVRKASFASHCFWMSMKLQIHSCSLTSEQWKRHDSLSKSFSKASRNRFWIAFVDVSLYICKLCSTLGLLDLHHI